ncbi:MAG: cell division protein ZapA [Devosia sp.]
MPEVNVEINGRKFRMACEEGQEQHLLGLADRFNQQIDQFKGTFGEIGDNRLTVMAGIAVLDELAEAERRIAQLQADVANLTDAGQAISHEAEALEQKFAKRLSEAARKIEAIATVIEDTGAAAN